MTDYTLEQLIALESKDVAHLKNVCGLATGSDKRSYTGNELADEFPDPDNVYIYYTSNRDSGILTESNEAVLIKELYSTVPETDGYTADSWAEISESHWAVGYVNGIIFQMIDDKGLLTKPARVILNHVQSLDNYPIRDEDDHIKRVWDRINDLSDRDLAWATGRDRLTWKLLNRAERMGVDTDSLWESIREYVGQHE